MVTTGFESRPADWLGVDEALSKILAGADPLPPERVPISECLGRALAEDVVAGATLPPWDNSAMDGFAVQGDDVAGATAAAPARLKVVRRIAAGDAPGPELRSGEAARIMTGAPIPPRADSVVRVEDTDGEAEPGTVVVLADRDAGQNVRPAGQDMRQGERPLARGHTITPGSVGVLAAAGRGDVLVHGRPTVALVTTGNELRGPDRFDEVRTGAGVPDSNAPMLAAMISAVGALPMSLGPAEDRPDAIRSCLERGEDADVLVTVGGASMGDADLVKRVLDEMGYRSEFWRVRMRPGSPLGFGWLPRGSRLQPVFSLPGNPTSAFVTFEVFVRPLLLRLAGHREIDRVTVLARSAESIPTPARLTYFLRVTLDGSGDALSVRPTGPQGSGLVAGLAYADGLAVIPEDVAMVERGASVGVRLIGSR